MHWQATRQTLPACAASSPPSSTNPSFPTWGWTTLPPPALATTLGKALASLLPPAKLWLRVGLQRSPSSEYAVFARLFGNRCACVPCFTIMRHTRRLVRLQLPSPPLQTRVDMFRDSMSPFVLAAASALVVFGRCRVPAQVVQWPELLGTMLSQRRRAHASLQDKVYLGKERLQLLCRGGPLSFLLLRLATVRDSIGCTSNEHIMKRYLSGAARRLWSKCMQTDRV